MEYNYKEGSTNYTQAFLFAQAQSEKHPMCQFDVIRFGERNFVVEQLGDFLKRRHLLTAGGQVYASFVQGKEVEH